MSRYPWETDGKYMDSNLSVLICGSVLYCYDVRAPMNGSDAVPPSSPETESGVHVTLAKIISM